MQLDSQQINELLRLVELTRDDEIDCTRCLDRVAEFAEAQLAGRPLHAGLRAVDHHLSICWECCEEYNALRRALESLT